MAIVKAEITLKDYNEVKKIIEEKDNAIEVLKEYEKWEAALIMDDAAWENGYPEINSNLYEWLLQIQEKRNKVLKSE